MTKPILSLAFCLLFGACQAGNNEKEEAPPTISDQENGLKKAYFASGCFWCVEKIYESVKGVKEAVSGYAGGHTEDPTYEEVGTGETGHAETVKVLYDPEKVSFKTLVKVYYASQDPTTKGQAPDFGSQYRSIIFYTNPEEKRIAQAQKDSVANSGAYDEPIVTEIAPLKKFWKAEAYHQDYAKKHPDKGYIKNVSNVRFREFKKEMPEVLKK